jgi:predicted acetyltransferase
MSGVQSFRRKPWKRNAGAATAALGVMLPLIAPTCLRFVDVTTDAENVASIRVIEAATGDENRRGEGAVRARRAPGSVPHPAPE